MTVIELMGYLSGMSEGRRVVIHADHGQNPETVSSVSEDFYQDPRDGALWACDHMEDEDYDNFEPVVVIWGQ